MLGKTVYMYKAKSLQRLIQFIRIISVGTPDHKRVKVYETNE